jgi:putative ABC transport system substrate-binding protein
MRDVICGSADAVGLGDPVQRPRPYGLINIPSPGVPPKLDAKHRAFLARIVEEGPISGGSRRGAMAGLRSDHATARGVRAFGVGRQHLSRAQELGLLACERASNPAATICPCCGKNLRKIGEDMTETLELVPRQWKVIRHVRENAGPAKQSRSRRHRPTRSPADAQVKGVPQSHHVHGLLAKGQEILSRLFPDLVPVLLACGAVPIDMGRDFRWYHFGVWKARFDSGINGMLITRPCLEWHIAERVRGDENLVKPRVSVFVQALADLGWTDGRNARIDFRWPSDDSNRIRALARELVGLQPDIILAIGATATAAIQRETRTIPIVFANVADPVASGILARLNQPGGNVTGFAGSEASLAGKWLELLSEIAPGLKRAAIMFNPNFVSASAFMPSLETAARSLKVMPITAPVHSDIEIDTAITALGREPGGGLVALTSAFLLAHRAQIISAAARNNVPAVYTLPAVARDGGLLSYGFDQLDSWPRAATYVDRILRGAKPGDLPVQFPTKFEMVVNLKTAKALGLAVPPSIRLRADEVIE